MRIVLSMVTNIIMIVLSLVVVGCMAVTMFLFLRRLNFIEEELWGKKKEEAEATVQEAEKTAEEEEEKEV